MKQHKIHVVGNIFGLTFVSVLLFFTFLDQLLLHDLPCPLCLLQRIGFTGIGLCFLLNLKNGIRISHYGLMLFFTLFGIAVSLRQISLHILPGTPGYGDAYLGLYLYEWAFAAFYIILFAIGVALLLSKGITARKTKNFWVVKILMVVFLSLVLANGVSSYLECGLGFCPDNPIKYDI